MRYFPVNLDVRGRDCLVVGGGAVAERKTKTLLDCDAVVTVVSPEVTEGLRERAVAARLLWERRTYRAEDLRGRGLVFAVTNRPEINRRVAEDARIAGVWVNVGDQPHLGDFTLPAVVDRGRLVMTVSTSGNSPALSRLIRKELERRYGEEYDAALRLLAAVRKKLLAASPDSAEHRRQFRRVLEEGLIDHLKHGRCDAVDLLLESVFGQGYEMKSLLTSDGNGSPE